jgi:hypothetical protein
MALKKSGSRVIERTNKRLLGFGAAVRSFTSKIYAANGVLPSTGSAQPERVSQMSMREALKNRDSAPSMAP